MGVYMFKSSPGQIRIVVPSIAGVILLLAAVISGRWFADSAYAHVLTAAGLQVTAMYVHFPLGAYVARLRQAAFDTLGANNGRRRLNPTRGIQ